MLIFTTHVGTVIDNPRILVYIPKVTPLPLILICDVSNGAGWKINNISLVFHQIPPSNKNGTNLIVFQPNNNTRYICTSGLIDGKEFTILIASEYVNRYIDHSVYEAKCMHECLTVHIDKFTMQQSASCKLALAKLFIIIN